jgi:hypothetical protein
VQRFPPAAKLPGAIDAGAANITSPKIPRRRIDLINRVILIAASLGDEAKPGARSRSVAFVSQVVLGEVLRILLPEGARKIGMLGGRRQKAEGKTQKAKIEK